ncbi:MAG: L-threonylcarbamoyladenylate synthase [Chthoniobacter sp.]|nr:L-threonylcarbamoyladenylate synthase [Chthoniobacter sp.]
MTTLVLEAADPLAIGRAVDLLVAGETVALPTETVYGLAADALRPEAVVKIFEAKERPFFDPLIVHLPTMDWLDRIAEIPRESRTLVDALIGEFWPGPLTLVLPRREIVPDIVTSGLDTIAVRMSAHPVFQVVIEKFAKPLAAPSANRFGRISPTASEHVFAELNNRIPLIVDGGGTMHGIESTIVRPEGDRIEILRSGPITQEQLSEFGEVRFAHAAGKPDAPGQLASHYAPRTPLEVCERASVRSALHSRAERKGFLAWQMAPEGIAWEPVEVLSVTGDLREAAATLFAKLRKLDDAGLEVIYVEPVPEHGLGIAIMDRLRKAAAPKP